MHGDSVRLLYQQTDIEPEAASSPTNTTLPVAASHAQLDKPRIPDVADLVHQGSARANRPMHAMLDCDSVVTLSTHENAI
jgi:L-aminopeptidase/D-esterase-like protein